MQPEEQAFQLQAPRPCTFTSRRNAKASQFPPRLRLLLLHRPRAHDLGGLWRLTSKPYTKPLNPKPSKCYVTMSKPSIPSILCTLRARLTLTEGGGGPKLPFLGRGPPTIRNFGFRGLVEGNPCMGISQNRGHPKTPSYYRTTPKQGTPILFSENPPFSTRKANPIEALDGVKKRMAKVTPPR